MTSITHGRDTGGLLIGELSRTTDVSAKTIRYYEKIGLMEPPIRTASGYRLYRPDAVERLQFIRGAKALGLSLEEIRAALGAGSTGETVCEIVQDFVYKKLVALDERIAELVRYRDQLREYMKQTREVPDTAGGTCRHVQGVVEGRWTSSFVAPSQDLGENRRRCPSESEDEDPDSV